VEGAQAHGGGECDGECAAAHLPSLSSPLTMADAPAASAAVTSLARAAAPGRPLLGGAAAAGIAAVASGRDGVTLYSVADRVKEREGGGVVDGGGPRGAPPSRRRMRLPSSFLQQPLRTWAAGDAALTGPPVWDGVDRLAAPAPRGGAPRVVSWPASAPEGSLDAAADSVELASALAALVSTAAGAVVVLADGSAAPLAALAAGAAPAPPPAPAGAVLAAAAAPGGAIVYIVSRAATGKGLVVDSFDAGAHAFGARAAAAASTSPLCAAAATPAGLALAHADGVIRVIDPASGAERWRATLAGATSAPAAGRKRAAARSDAPASSGPALTATADGGLAVLHWGAGGDLRVALVDAALGAPRATATVAPPPGMAPSTHLTLVDAGNGILLVIAPGGAACVTLDAGAGGGLASVVGAGAPSASARGFFADAGAPAHGVVVEPAWATAAATPAAAPTDARAVAVAVEPAPGVATPSQPALEAATAVATMEAALASGTTGAAPAKAAAARWAAAAVLERPPADALARGAAVAGAHGAWDAVRAVLAHRTLRSGAAATGLLPAAAAAGEYRLLVAAAAAPHHDPADVAAVVAHALLGGAAKHAAPLASLRRDAAAAAADAVAAAEAAPAGSAARALAARKAAAAVAAVDGFEGGELLLHTVVAAPRDDAALAASMAALPPAAAPLLAAYLAKWALALAGPAGGADGAGVGRPGKTLAPAPSLAAVAAWAAALVDAHLPALAGDPTCHDAVRALHAVAAAEADDAAALAPLAGAAAHVAAGAALPASATAAAAMYSVELLDVGVAVGGSRR